MLFQDGRRRRYFRDPISADELFADLSSNGRDQLAALETHIKVLSGKTVFASGDAANSIYIHRGGRTSLYFETARQSALFASPARADRIYGIVEALSEKPFDTGMKTLTKCDFDIIDRDEFLSFLRTEPELCLRLSEILGRLYQTAVATLRSH